MDDLDLRMGGFVVWNGCTYREQRYMITNEYELYDVSDIHYQKPIRRISAENVSDSFTQIAHCQYKGIEYVAFYIERDNCFFKRNINHTDDKICSISIYDMDEIWMRINRKNNLQ